MAFNIKVLKKITRIMILIFMTMPVTSANIDCDGKSFHCVNSTHFMICVDLGAGVLSALDSFVLQCPPSTECVKTNRYECEFPKPVKLEIIGESDVLPVTESTTIFTETSASSPKVFSSYKTGNSDSSITEVVEVTNYMYADISDPPQDSKDVILPGTTESIKSLMVTDTASETKHVRNSLGHIISPNKTDTAHVSTFDRALNQTFQDLVDINVSSIIDYQTSEYTSNISKSETPQIINDTMIPTTIAFFKIPTENVTDSVLTLNTNTQLLEESTTNSPLSSTDYLKTITENQELNKQFNRSIKNTTKQNKIEAFKSSTDTNLLNISDIFPGFTGINVQSTITISSILNNKNNFSQAPINNNISHTFEYPINRANSNISSTTKSNEIPIDISTAAEPFYDELPNSNIFRRPNEISHSETASSSSKSISLQELTTNAPSRKEYFQTTTDTSINTQMYQLKYSDNKTELSEVVDNTSSTIAFNQMSKDSTMSIARDQSDVNIKHENNKHVTKSKSIYELLYNPKDSEYNITTAKTFIDPSKASTIIINFDNIFENNFDKTNDSPDLYSNINNDYINQSYTTEVYVKNITDVHNKDKLVNKVTFDKSTMYEITKTNFSNLSPDMTTISDIVTSTYKDININKVTKMKELNIPATENNPDTTPINDIATSTFKNININTITKIEELDTPTTETSPDTITISDSVTSTYKDININTVTKMQKIDTPTTETSPDTTTISDSVTSTYKDININTVTKMKKNYTPTIENSPDMTTTIDIVTSTYKDININTVTKMKELNKPTTENNPDTTPINDIERSTFKNIHIDIITKMEELDTPTTENSRNQQIPTENDFQINIMSNISKYIGTTDTVATNIMEPLDVKGDIDLGSTHSKLFSTLPTLVEVSSNTENAAQAKGNYLEHTTPYVAITNPTYDDIKYTDAKDSIANFNNNRSVNMTNQSDNLDELNLELVNVLNNTYNVELQNISTIDISLTSYTTESYKNAVLNNNETSYITSVSGLEEIAQNSKLQTTTMNNYVNSTTEFVEKGNQLVFPETTTTSADVLAYIEKNEYSDVFKTKQTDIEYSYDLHFNTNSSLISSLGTSPIAVDSKFSDQVTASYSLFIDNTDTMMLESNKNDRKNMQVTTDQIKTISKNTNKQKVSDLITEKNNAKVGYLGINSTRKSESNIDESNLETVNIRNSTKRLATTAEYFTSYTTEPNENMITTLIDNIINQTSVTSSFSGLSEKTTATNTDANNTADFFENDKPLNILKTTTTSNTELLFKIKNDHYDILKTMQTDSLISEPVTKTSNYNSFFNIKNTTVQKFNETGTNYIPVITDQSRITSANMQKVFETTTEIMAVNKNNASVERGLHVSNSKRDNFSVTDNVTKMFLVRNLTSFQKPDTVKVEIKNVDYIVDYQIPETTRDYLQVGSKNELNTTYLSNLPLTTEYSKDKKSTIANRLITQPPSTFYQITDKAFVNDTQDGVNDIYRTIHESLTTMSHKESVLPFFLNTRYNPINKSISRNNTNSQTLHTTKKTTNNIQTKTDTNNRANTIEISKNLSSQSSQNELTNIIKKYSLNTSRSTQDNQNNTIKKEEATKKVLDKIANITDSAIFSPSSVFQYKEVAKTIPILHITTKNSTQGVTHTKTANVTLNFTTRAFSNDNVKQMLNISSSNPTNLNVTKLLVFHTKIKPTQAIVKTTNGTRDYRSKPLNYSYFNNSSQNEQVGNNSLISFKTNKGGNQINSTESIINLKHRNSLQTLFGMNNKTISKISQQNSLYKNNTMEKNTTRILEKSEGLGHERKLQFRCRSRSRGRYSDKEDCSIYYICIGKLEPKIGKCPVHTVFSDIRKQCTKNMSHCIRESEFKCTTVGRYSDISKPNTYYICVRRNKSFLRYKFQCLNGYYLNKTLVKCMIDNEPESQHQTSISYDSNKSDISFNEKSITKKTRRKIDQIKKSEDIFKCEKEGKFANESDCRKYYLCTRHNKTEFRTRKKKCDSDEVFHRDKKKCVDADSYEC